MKRYVVCWAVANVMAVVVLWVVMAVMGGGCTKKATKIEYEVVPDSSPAIEETVEKRAPAQYFAPGKERIERVIVYFDFDRDVLKPQEAAKIQYLAGGTGTLQIIGHACTIGTEEYNMALGLARANRVREHLLRGDVRSYGEELCLAECESLDEYECRECRKVEVVVQ